MDIIQLLPDHVANQIAAGEVIQRPSSAVKEMLENALDAGANQIQLYIKDAGKTLLQVVDNGCGMSKNDAKICFQRHATSKIKGINDLFEIRTMGFRGEAMASIAAISHVELNTKLTEEKIGTQLAIEGGEIQSEKESVCANGTSIKVKNLFYNVPARRNFLKSDKVELRHITEEFTRIALANPQIKMQFFHNNNELFHLPKSNLRQRIVNLIGGKKNEILVPIEEKTSLVKITGFIGKPESAKRTRGEQYFFVNGRFIKNHYLNHAVNKAFEGLIPSNYFPSHFINLEINPSRIDINIHPTKTEIKFEDEKEIYAIIRATIKRSLGTYNIAPSLDFSQESAFTIDYKKESLIQEPKIKIDNTYNPFAKDKSKKTTSQFIEQTEIYQEEQQNRLNKQDDMYAIQIKGEFIAYSTSDGLLLINQVRAHKRILFEYFKKALNKSINQSQKLLFPKLITLNNKDITLIMELHEILADIGFIFDQVDKETISINGVPPECKDANLQFLIENLLEQYKSENSIEIEQKEKIAVSLSTSLCINKKKILSQKEMKTLKEELLKCENPTICPLGKKTMINIKHSELEKYF